MDFLNLAKERFSARAFSAQAVEEDKVNYLLECAQRAPSACNKQPWHFVVAQTEEARQKVQQCYLLLKKIPRKATLRTKVCAFAANIYNLP